MKVQPGEACKKVSIAQPSMYWQSNWHPHLLWHFAPTLATYCGWCKCWSTVAARFAATVWDCDGLETRIFLTSVMVAIFQVFGFSSWHIQCSLRLKTTVIYCSNTSQLLNVCFCLFDTAPHFGSPTASMITAMDNQKPGSSNLWTRLDLWAVKWKSRNTTGIPTFPQTKMIINKIHMDVSGNSGTPKSSILIGFSITTIFGNTHMTVWVTLCHKKRKHHGTIRSLAI